MSRRSVCRMIEQASGHAVPSVTIARSTIGAALQILTRRFCVRWSTTRTLLYQSLDGVKQRQLCRARIFARSPWNAPMKLALFSVSYAGFWGQDRLDLEAFLRQAAALGYEAV